MKMDQDFDVILSTILARLMFKLSWNDTKDEYNSILWLSYSLCLWGERIRSYPCADLCPIPINDSSDASEKPDLQNDVSKIPCTPRNFIFSFFWTFALACFVLTTRSTKRTSVQEDQSINGYTSLAFMLSDFNKVSKCKLFNFKILKVNNRCVEHKVVLFN